MTIVDVASVLGDLKKWQEVADENAELRAALESIIRRWEESEKISMLGCAMAEDARAVLRKLG